MSTVFLIIWVLFIVVGVVSNIRKSIQKARPSSQSLAGSSQPAQNEQSLQAARAIALRLQQQREQQAEAALRVAQSQVHSRTIASVQTEASQPSVQAKPATLRRPTAVVSPEADVQSAADLGTPMPPVPSTMSLPSFEEHGRSMVSWSIFSSRVGIVQAIIAQQVLSPPLALAEQSIWNQR